MHLVSVRGALCLDSTTTAALISQLDLSLVPEPLSRNRVSRDGPEHHITVVEKREISSLPSRPPSQREAGASTDPVFQCFQTILQEVNGLSPHRSSPGRSQTRDYLTDILVLPVASLPDLPAGRTVICAPILCPLLAIFRARMGLPYKHLHVTLGFDRKGDFYMGDNDVGLDIRAPGSLHYLPPGMVIAVSHFDALRNWPLVIETGLLSQAERASQERLIIDLASFTLRATQLNDEFTDRKVEVLCARSRAYGWLGRREDCLQDALEAFSSRSPPTLAAVLALSSVYTSMHNDTASLEVLAASLKQTGTRADDPTFEEIWGKLRLLADKCVRRALAGSNPSSEPRYRLSFGSINLPRNLSFVDIRKDHSHSLQTLEADRTHIPSISSLQQPDMQPQKLTIVGSSKPENIVQLQILHLLLGVTDVVTLMEDPLSLDLTRPFDDTLASKTSPPLTFHHLKVENYHPPTVSQMSYILHTIIPRSRGRILFHCGGGKGRAGTVIAALMIHVRAEGESVSSVVEKLRRMRPGSIETKRQEDFLKEFADWSLREKQRMMDVGQESPQKAETFPPSTAAASKLPRLLMLSGPPGSGKSTFAKTLITLRPDTDIIHINQDDLGGSKKLALDNLYDNFAGGSSTNRDRCVILDRCFMGAEERREWLEVLGDKIEPTDVWIVYWEWPGTGKAELIRRVAGRECHPLLSSSLANDTSKSNTEVRLTKVKRVVDDFLKKWEAPEMKEGWGRIIRIGAEDVGQDTDRSTNSVLGELSGTSSESIPDVVRKVLSTESLDLGPSCEPTRTNGTIVLPTRQLRQPPSSRPPFIPDKVRERRLGHSPSVSRAPTKGGTIPHGLDWIVQTKFPRTPHLFVLASPASDSAEHIARTDLVFDGFDALKFFDGLQAAAHTATLTVEEKIDGANLGISIDPVTQRLRLQNRGKLIVPSPEGRDQFGQGLATWIEKKQGELRRICYGGSEDSAPGKPTFMVFGEWLWAKHSILYENLQDYFVIFDLLDLEAMRFLSVSSRNAILGKSGCTIPTVPSVGVGATFHREIKAAVASQKPTRLLAVVEDLISSTPSDFTDKSPIEGLYFRIDQFDTPDTEARTYLRSRAKVVRSDFVQNIEDSGHWMKRSLVRNSIRRGLPY